MQRIAEEDDKGHAQGEQFGTEQDVHACASVFSERAPAEVRVTS